MPFGLGRPRRNHFYDYAPRLNARNVVTVCDETSAERCPVFPGPTERLHWGFADPSALGGTREEKLAATLIIRDQIKNHIEREFCARHCPIETT